MARRKRASLAPGAENDIRQVLDISTQNFGSAAAARYRALIKRALRDVEQNPTRPGSKEWPELMVEGARTYPISFSRHRVRGASVKDPRHVLLYRVRADGAIEIARVIHDSRELERHIPEEYRRETS